MSFLKEDFKESKEATNKRSKAVLTNLGAESEFATLDNDLRKVGGSTSLNTISNKHVIAKNELFKKERWITLSQKEKEAKWNWAKNSEQAKLIKIKEEEFWSKIQSVKKDAYKAKEMQKKKATSKMLEALELCKEHGGPLK